GAALSCILGKPDRFRATYNWPQLWAAVESESAGAAGGGIVAWLAHPSLVCRNSSRVTPLNYSPWISVTTVPHALSATPVPIVSRVKSSALLLGRRHNKE